jgi:hypothetical protein
MSTRAERIDQILSEHPVRTHNQPAHANSALVPSGRAQRTCVDTL